MTSTVIGNGPLTFTDSNGKQVSIPLSALQFDPSGSLVLNPKYPQDPEWQSNAGLIQKLLTYLASNQLIVQPPAAALKPAIVLQASDPLGAGNKIEVDITVGAPNTDPTLTPFTLAVTETDTYKDLTVDTIAQILGKVSGSTPTAGSQPGLVLVEGDGPYLLPDPVNNIPLESGATGAVSFHEFKAGSSIALKLVAKRKGDDGNLTMVSITRGSDPKTFGLNCTWTKSQSFTLKTLPTPQAQSSYALDYVLTLNLPNSRIYSLPDSTIPKYPLSGGANGILPSTIVYAASN